MGTIAPDKSSIVNVTRLAEITGRSRWWARAKLDEWFAEQESGGPKRVFKKGRRGSLFTTIAIVQQEFVGVHDPVMKRKVRDLESAIDFLTKRVNQLSDQITELRYSVRHNGRHE